MSARFLAHPLLEARGVVHGFGVRDAPAPPGLVRPVQVHGAVVVAAADCRRERCEADGVVSREPGVAIGVATADCVPILLASPRGDSVAALHAGWRGLARGVVPNGVARLREAAGLAAEARGDGLCAAIGPHIGPCCYEVDAPVLDALRERFGAALDDALRPTRPGHAALDLGLLARSALLATGIAPEQVGGLPGTCTRCDPERFHSHRRDGRRAGRLLHFVVARALEA